FTAAGGKAHVVSNRDAAVAKVVELVRDQSARRVLLGRGTFLDALNLQEPLSALGVEVVRIDTLSAVGSREAFFAADLGISGVDHVVAETGTIAFLARREEPRSLSLLPSVHVAVAHRSQIIPDLFDLFEPAVGDEPRALPSCLSLITGPSKTGDIELNL